MSIFNQIDIDVRLQLIGCKYAELANIYANDLKYGRKCAKSNLKKLIILNAYIELIEKFKVDMLEVSDILPLYTLEIIYVSLLPITISISMNGTQLTNGSLSLLSTDSETVALQIATDINNHQSIYTATVNTNIITIPGLTCSQNMNSSIVVEGADYSYNEEIINGICGTPNITYNNCITEKKLDDIFDNISKITGLCFQPKGFEYTP